MFVEKVLYNTLPVFYGKLMNSCDHHHLNSNNTQPNRDYKIADTTLVL